VLPTLAASATVLLVGGQTKVDADAPDDHEARAALMRVLAHAVRAERAPARLTVRTVDHSWSAEELAAATGARASAMPSGDPASEETIGKAYADWRTEVLGLMRVEF